MDTIENNMDIKVLEHFDLMMWIDIAALATPLKFKSPNGSERYPILPFLADPQLWFVGVHRYPACSSKGNSATVE